MKNKYEIRGEETIIFLDYKGSIIECKIDTEDFEKVNSFPKKWLVNGNGNNLYAGAYEPIVKGKKKKWIRMHRFILDPSPELVVDHINHNTLDNRKSNLRAVTTLINNQNQKGPRIDNTSGHRNVYWNKQCNKWVGKFSLEGKFQHVGYFDDIEDAVSAVKRARAKFMEGSQEALTIKIPKDENVLFDPNKPHITNKSGVKHVHWNKASNRWNVLVKGVSYGFFETLEEAESVANLARKGEIEPPQKGTANCNSKSGVRGVHWHKREKKWNVTISVNGKSRIHGRFANFEDAVKKAEEIRSTLI